MRKAILIAAGLACLSAGAAVLPGLAAVDTVVAKMVGRAVVPLPPAHPLSAQARARFDDERATALTAPDPLTALPPLAAMIGQLLVVGFASDDVATAPAQNLIVEIGDGRVGGVLYFAHNVASLSAVERMNTAFRAAAPHLPLLVAVDQEGGKVQRLRDRHGFPETPSAAEMATLSQGERVAIYARLADELSALGFNLNLGPVVDLAIEDENTVVVRNGRTYATDSSAVVASARDFVEAHRRAGLATALKHFPGHGSSTGDSHDGSVDISATWSPAELEPYQMLSAAGLADMVMVGHLTVEAGQGPVSLANDGIADLLRGEVGFDGLTISDDLTMGGASNGSGRHPVVDAVMAGNDVIIVSGLMKGLQGDLVAALHKVLAEAASADPAVYARITEAYRKVAAFKLERFGHPVRRARLAALTSHPR